MRYPELIKDYFRYREQIRSISTELESFQKFFLYKYFLKWRFYRKESDSLKWELPWITFPAIAHISKYLKKEMRVFEYGSGGSTLYFSRRVKEVISFEHDKEWYSKLKDTLNRKCIKNVDIKLIEPEINGIGDQVYTSENELYKGYSFMKYVQEIEIYPDNHFDLILIDGRARNACFIHAKKKIKNEGIIVFDNTERDRYRNKFISNDFIDLAGPTPYSKVFTITTIFPY
jgi:hypothetical protein